MYKLASRGQAARAQRHDLPTTRAWAGKVGTNPTQDGGEQANKQTSKEDQLQTKSSKQITKPIQILPNGVTSTIPENSNRAKRNIYFPVFLLVDCGVWFVVCRVPSESSRPHPCGESILHCPAKKVYVAGRIPYFKNLLASCNVQ